MQTWLPIALSIGLLAGCTVAEHDFPEAYGKAMCKRMKQCERGEYDNTWDDKAECVDDMAEFADFFLDAGDLLGQEYVPELGYDCIREVKGASCAEFEDGEYDCEVFE